MVEAGYCSPTDLRDDVGGSNGVANKALLITTMPN